MTKNELISELLELPEEVYNAELEVIEAYEQVQKKKDLLVAKEDELLMSGTIDGKNAETRQAQLRNFTADERQAVQQAENELSKIRALLNLRRDILSSYKAIAKLLGEAE